MARVKVHMSYDKFMEYAKKKGASEKKAREVWERVQKDNEEKKG